VFTVAGDPSRYKDGRRDLRLSLEEHFLEQIEVYNGSVFTNDRRNRALRRDVFDLDPRGHDLVYLDPPYVPRHDDNCYMKRYHFLEGLSLYWEGLRILTNTKVKKIEKPFTPFSYRRHALDAFDRLFGHFAESTVVLSYSSNGYPDLNILTDLLGRHKKSIRVHERPHRYHFGTHHKARRTLVQEYLIVGE
jgi:adenine-specific DNA-methyltransferase